MFNIIREYHGRKFHEIENSVREALFRAMEKETFHIEDSDFLSLDKADLRFNLVPSDKGDKCSLSIEIQRAGKTTFEFDEMQDIELQKLSDRSFLIKGQVKEKHNQVDNKKYDMMMTVIEDSDEPNYVFSFSMTKDRGDYNPGRRVFAYHTGSDTGSSGRRLW